MIDSKIPFKDFVLTNQHFDYMKTINIENYNFSMKFNDEKQCLTIKFNCIPAPMYYFTDKGIHYYSFDEELLYNYLCEIQVLGPKAMRKDFICDYSTQKLSDNVKQFHKHHGFFCVVNYEEFNIYENKNHFTHINTFYSVPIEKSGTIIQNWITKYKKLITDNAENIVVELSAGLDTRSLTYFWKENNKVTNIYSKKTEDGITIEIPIAKQILEYIEKKYNHPTNLSFETNIKNKKITLSGKTADVFGPIWRINNLKYLDGIVSIKSWKKAFFDICPYRDLELLKISPNYANELKYALQVLLSEEFLDIIPYYSFARDPVVFTEEIKNNAYKLINLWNIKL